MAELRGSHGKSAGPVLTRWFGTENLHQLDIYVKKGGYASWRKALTSMDPAAITAEVKTSGLRGRGGAGFPTGQKWSFIPRDMPGPKYVVVNADESEPGTAKDRYLMENSPHQLLEGIAIAAFAVGANQAWIYIRGEYDRPHAMLAEAIAEATKAGHLGKDVYGKGFDVDIRLYRGHGAYICGEETALLESLEGKRAQPRSRPPFPAVKGAWGRPTLINNVETLSTLPWIIEKGGAEYAKLGTEQSRGTRLFTVSGHVQRPGNYEMEIGRPFRDLIEGMAGGALPGRTLKVFWPGGSSAPVLPASMLDTTTDTEELKKLGTMGGSGGVIVMDDSYCVVRGAYRLLQFYAYESCGKCTPCRIGGNWAVRAYERLLAGEDGPAQLQLLDRIQAGLQNGRCLCGLGDSAGWVIESTMNHFRNEYDEHAHGNVCSAAGAMAVA
ncbi:MAG TPA: NADH-quinone oxidoreductase subunit NuoF [Candidatus Dormibacteraeota bacterium]